MGAPHAGHQSKPRLAYVLDNAGVDVEQVVTLLRQLSERDVIAGNANAWRTVMPGLRGTPAGMMTTSHPESASISCEAPEKARTCADRR